MSSANYIHAQLDSANILEFHYVRDTQDLYIVFTNRSVYVYRDVDFAVVLGMLSTKSAGKFFHSRIKNVFNFEQLVGTYGYNPDAAHIISIDKVPMCIVQMWLRDIEFEKLLTEYEAHSENVSVEAVHIKDLRF